MDESLLTFDSELHKYYYDGRELLSVTTLLKSVGIIDDRFYTDEGKNRGRRIHHICEKIDLGEMPEIESSEMPYIEAYLTFKHETRFVPQLIEKRVCNINYWYGGTLDKTGLLYEDCLAIIDLKTGVASPWTALQLAGYEACLDKPHKRFGLQLNKNGKYKLIPYEDRSDRNMFLGIASVVNWKMKNLKRI